MTTQLWGAVSDLADRWRESPTVHSVTSVMPRDGRPSKSAMTAMLSELRGMSMRGHPLRLGSELRYLLGQPYFDHVARPKEFEGWLAAAHMIEAPFRVQLAWVRAQLPGYPLLRVPQMVENTPFTTLEFTWNAPWPRDDMARGFQLSPPPVVLIGDERNDMSRELRRVATALQASEPWQRFAEARAALTTSDATALSAACRALRAALSPERVNAHEPNLAIKRDQYRREQMEEALAGLSEGAATYANAFTVAADAVDLAIDQVLPQVVTYGLPRDIGAASDLDFLDAENISLSPSVPILWTGELAFVSDPLVEEVGQVTRTSFAMEHGVTSLRAELRLIPGAAASWGL